MLTHFNSGRTDKVGASYSIRASRAIRVLLTREGTVWNVTDIVRRGDKRVYRHEL